MNLKADWKRKVIYIITVILSIAYLMIGNQLAGQGWRDYSEGTTGEIIEARVTQLLEVSEAELEKYGEIIRFDAEIISGIQKGLTVTAQQDLLPGDPMDMRPVKEGDKVLLVENTGPDEEIRWYLGEYVRSDAVFILGGIFAILLLLFGRGKGLNTLISLVFTCLAVFMVFIPAILSGQNIYLWAIITCAFITIMTMLLVVGANVKSLTTGLGCAGGVLVASLLTLIMNQILQLTGIVDEESMYLIYMNLDDPIDLRAIVFAAIIVGAIGAIMDVAMDISAALHELKEQVPESTPKSLMKSGITIGRDILGTMMNTLILAYIGSSLSVVLLLVAYNDSLIFLLNREMVIVEILQSLVGSFGILFAIPFTSFICGVFYTRNDRRGLRAKRSNNES